MEESFLVGEMELAGFRALPCRLEPSGHVRLVYVKLHRGKGKKEERTLFVTNIPPMCPVVELVRLFSQFGEISALSHGSLNQKALGKVRDPQNVMKLQRLDPNLNINVGRPSRSTMISSTSV